jgi:hypothetical protein
MNSPKTKTERYPRIGGSSVEELEALEHAGPVVANGIAAFVSQRDGGFRLASFERLLGFVKCSLDH